MADSYIISIDMGGTKILGSVLHKEQGILKRYKKATNIDEGTEQYIHDLADVVKQLVEEANLTEESIKGVCIGVPGSVNYKTGHIGIAPNLGIKDFNLKEELSHYLPYPILIENDVNLAALGIQYAGAAKGKNNVLVVFVGTGIGGGIILNGKLYRGSSFVAGEIGHMVINRKGPKCGCGMKGCFEAFASRTAMVKEITKKIEKGKDSFLKEYVKEDKRIKSKAIAQAIAGGDKVTVKAVGKASKIIGRTLAMINNLMNFEMIVLGGGVIEANEEFMMPVIEKAFKKYSLKDAGKAVELRATILGDDAPLYGGFPLADEL
jgi:glucokinase